MNSSLLYMVSPKLINQLEGRKKLIQNQGFQYMIQPGHNTIICHDVLNSINDPYSVSNFDDESGFTGTPSTTNNFYFWDQKLQMTLQNHSSLPMYITARYYRARDNIPKGVSDFTLSTTFSTAVKQSARVPLLRQALLEYGLASSDLKHGQQGIYKDGLFQVTEGMGIVGVSTASTAKTYSDTYGNHYSIAVPLGITSSCRIWDGLYKEFNSKTFVLNPEQMTSLSLQDTDMHYRSGETSTVAELDPFDRLIYLDNKYTKFIVLEVHGSLIGQDPEVLQTADNMAATWAATTGFAETLDFGDIADRVSTAGGVLYVHYHKTLSGGRLTNLERPDVHLDVQLSEVGFAANPYGSSGHMPDKSSG